MKILNLNIGLLGHVDSGKTSLAKVLSQVASTAAFDKNPQSQERGITIDLGFSSFTSAIPSHLSNTAYEELQFTLVDCPGHASLIKTVIGGSHIIDMIVLVVDATKGMQTQTAECLIIGEITKKKMIVVLNKIDLLEGEKPLEKLMKKMRLTMDSTEFKGCPLVTASALQNNVKNLVEILEKEAFVPERSPEKPFLFAVDHCFAIKGKGTVLTGTVLQGVVKVNDEIEMPSIGLVKKVKSIQMFKKPVDSAMQGDRAGVCVTQFDPSLLERGLAAQVHYVPTMYAAVLDFNKVRFYKNTISSKSTYHINVGYENVLAKIVLFEALPGKSQDFKWSEEYRYVPEITEGTEAANKIYALLEFTKPIQVVPKSLTIGARLDTSVHSSTCRLAFYGTLLAVAETKSYQTEFLSRLKIFKEKCKNGIVERMANEYEVVGKNMFKKETNLQKFVGMRVTLSSGEEGIIEGGFGQSGKFKVRISEGLKESSLQLLSSKKKSASEETKASPIEISLRHKRYIFDSSKKMIQSR